ncbi:hypothetical protein [Endozoicomonas euniceicola]|uniref:Uncharacterized protein n=1 Tax=Endozoicomonas euniceicola TaxID=1234143 RepID=A0ABY6GSK5_9GAMM|nr:hypothetical protein [Endozoicomonas euniceicola]UYM15740.1 hypothetical protein NX720_23415 [Endozoicomonas euniceicola]
MTHNIKYLKKKTFTALCFILFCIVSNSTHAVYYKVTKSDISFFIELSTIDSDSPLRLPVNDVNASSDFTIEEINSNNIAELQEQAVYNLRGTSPDSFNHIIQHLNCIYQTLSHPRFRHISNQIFEDDSHSLYINITINDHSNINVSEIMTRAAEIADQQVNSGAFTSWHPRPGGIMHNGSYIISLALTTSLQSTADSNRAEPISSPLAGIVNHAVDAFSQEIPRVPISYFSVTRANGRNTQRSPVIGLNYILPANEALSSTQRQELMRSGGEFLTPETENYARQRFIIAHTFQNTEESFNQMMSRMETLRSNLRTAGNHFTLRPFDFFPSDNRRHLTIYFMLYNLIRPEEKADAVLTVKGLRSIITPNSGLNTDNTIILGWQRPIYLYVTNPSLGEITHRTNPAMRLMTSLMNGVTTIWRFIAQIANPMSQTTSSEEEITEAITERPQPEENSPNGTSTEDPQPQESPVIYRHLNTRQFSNKE